MDHSSWRWLPASLALFLLAPAIACAHGALAVGITGDIAKDGYSLGINVNSQTPEKAREQALNWCRTHGGPLSKPKCKVISTFQHQCAAEAEDPQAGTSGAGWAVGATKEDAEKIAMSNCVAAAGKARQKLCKVTASLCDTTL